MIVKLLASITSIGMSLIGIISVLTGNESLHHARTDLLWVCVLAFIQAIGLIVAWARINRMENRT